jgi:hypothetical protein
VPLPLTGVPLQPELGLSLQLPSTPDQKPVLGSQMMTGVPKKPCLHSAAHRYFVYKAVDTKLQPLAVHPARRHDTKKIVTKDGEC